MERMSPLDASFLHIEDDVSHMHIGSVAIFEGPPPPYEDVSTMVAGKLPLVPRYRQKVRFVPFALGRPVWVDDPHFNLGYHLRHTALPAPGGDEQLRNLVGRVMSQQLDRAKPLWEMWMVEGLEEGRWALRVEGAPLHGRRRLRHRPAHGGARPRARRRSRRARRAGTRSAAPSGVQLLRRRARRAPVSPYELFRAARATLRAPRQFASLVEDTARSLSGCAGSCGPRRRPRSTARSARTVAGTGRARSSPT